ncbi:MAG TPA: alpha/beta fold hydrolase [Gemmatimonadales bacterium]|jgi:oxygen-independent coproporphyrinogen-3 oxidase
MKQADSVRVVTDDGVTLGLWRVGHTTPARTIPLLLMHGTFSNRNFFGATEGLGPWLAERGHDAWVGELRGFDRSGEGRHDKWEVEDWILHDAPALLRAVREATGSARVLWIGHSAGAVIAVGCAARFADCAESLHGMVLAAAPAPDRPGTFNTAVSLLGRGVSALVGRLPARALGIGPEDEGPGILGQWSDWIIGRKWVGRDGFDYLPGARKIIAPALAIAGASDLLTPPSTCRRLLDALGSADKTMIVAGRRQGFRRDYSHNRLLISSDARRDVWPVIAEWIEART